MHKPNRTTGAQKSTFFDINGWWVCVVIALILLCVGWVWNMRSPRLTASQQMNGHSNGFYGGPVHDEYQAPPSGTYQEHLQLPIALFITSPEDKKVISLVFKYRTHGSFGKLWLVFKTKPGSSPLRVLVDSELLRSFYPPLIQSSGVSLFQKEIVYSSMTDFFAHPPTSTVVVDSALQSQLLQRGITLPNVVLSENWTLTTKFPDFWLTRFTKPRMFPDDWYEAGPIINVTDVLREANGTIRVELQAEQPGAYIDMTKPSSYWSN